MPELPEVETVRRGLESLVLGARIESSLVFRDSCVRRHPFGVAQFDSLIAGATIVALARRGKFLWFVLDGPAGAERIALSAHLGMSGQFRVFTDELPEPHQHCRARLLATAPDARRVAIDFLDQRTFGYLHAEPFTDVPDGAPGGHGSELTQVPVSVAHIARDVMDPALDRGALHRRLTRGSRAIKSVLLDQSAVSGIGNIYADEALWAARVHPATPASALGLRTAARVVDAATEVMARALGQGGTSFDALYVNVNGESGYFSRDLEAYGRAGKACSRCGTSLVGGRLGGRSTHWCPRCQKA